MSPEIQEGQNLGGKLRFDVYEADPRTGELHKHGIRIPLEDRPFRALLILLTRVHELVTREELKQQLWPSDIFIDFDHGLNTVIRKIRLALNDRADEPRFIETVGRRGYRFLAPVKQEAGAAPEPGFDESRKINASAFSQQTQVAPAAAKPSLPENKRVYFRRVPAIAACVVLVLFLAYLFRPAMSLPRVSRITQLTKSGSARAWEPLYTDGPRVYYQSTGALAADWQLRQVLLNGSEDKPADVPAGRYRIRGLSTDDTEFLATSLLDESTVWRLPVSGGSPRRVGNLVADDIAWSHDGSTFAYAQGNRLFLANVDGTSSRPLAALPDSTAVISHIRWSPDDRRLRFTKITATTRTLWEIGADGRNLHELRFHWPGNAMECCGEWTPDGRYFVFSSRREGSSNLWALEENSDWWRRANRDPVQLTTGPVDYYQPVPSRNSKSIFAVGVQPSGELVRYDAARKDFVPFLGGRSFAHLAFSRDGQWLAYVAYPEGTLWRARSDGTEPLQLTFPPLQVGSPHWSSNGKRIAFHAIQTGQMWRDFLISADGGNPEPFPSEPLSQTSPDWMSDRDALTYSRAYEAENPALYQFDLRSGRSEKIPGTDGLYGAQWSPDGRSLAAVEPAGNTLFLVDLKSGKRTQLTAPAMWPTWSADSQYIYFTRFGVNWIFRVHVADGKEEKVLELPFRVTPWPFTVTPDGSVVILREHGHYDVYALYLSLP
jgi:Tol biopolymer transport system component/DNA-binding winged helix-turn-helix (wHTH) protein